MHSEVHIPYLQKSNPSVLPTFAMFTARQRFIGRARGGQSCFSNTRTPRPAVVPPRPAEVVIPYASAFCILRFDCI